MQRSSESIGALAAALAKAQAEIQNPEKSLTAAIVSPFPREGVRSFRYASLSAGLDLVRKCLGQHEIATVQATAIDQDKGLISLTTTLVHASGEWVSSDWPVCPVSETAAPHRLGAALTYARRYALFTLVGIAGEDDVDAPDLAPTVAGQPPLTQVSGGSVPAAAKRARSDRSSPLQLKPSDSETLRLRLLSELEQLADGEAMAAWAHRVLPLKNQLLAEDCHALEAGFAARLRALGEVATEEGSENQEAHAKEPGQGRSEPAFAEPAHAEPVQTVVTVIAKPVRERDRNHCALWRGSLALPAAVLPAIPTTSSLPNRGRWGARSATASPFRFAGSTTGSSIAVATNAAGGSSTTSIHWPLRQGCGPSPMRWKKPRQAWKAKRSAFSQSATGGGNLATERVLEGIRCDHCDAVNRRPVCGRCRSELVEPLFIKVAWLVFHFRKQLYLVFAVAGVCIYMWTPWELFQSPRNYVECKERAARTARSNAAMYVLISNCSARFPQSP